MDAALLRCLLFLLLLGIISGESYGSSAEVIRRTQRSDFPQGQSLYSNSETYTTMHDTYPTIIGSPTDSTPTLNPSPMTPTPTTTPTTPMMGPPTMPTTVPPPTTTVTPMPPSGGGFGGGGNGGGGAGGGTPTTPTITPMPPSGGGFGGSGSGGGGGGGSWCVAKSSASEKALQVGLDYACGYGGADCSQIQQGGSCYNPDTIHDHASFAYNAYYQKNPAPTSCDFGGTAQLVSTDPSSGSCHFPSKGSASPTPATPTPTMQTPPGAMMSPPSPPNTLMPGTPLGGATVFGPTSSPNLASTQSQQLLLFFSSTSILLYSLLVIPV